MKYEVTATSSFKKELKIIKKRNKDLNKLKFVVDTLASGEILEKTTTNMIQKISPIFAVNPLFSKEI